MLVNYSDNRLNYKKVFTILMITHLILFLITFQVDAQDEQLIDLNLKGVDLRDALRSIAELAEVNLIIDDSVNGRITILLRKLTFKKALNLIVQSKGLGYVIIDETVVVATPERIEKLYESREIDRFKLNYRKAVDIKKILTPLFPELIIEKDEIGNYILLKGKEDSFKEVKELIIRLDQPQANTNDISKIYKFVNIENCNLEEIKNNVLCVYPQLKVNINKNMKKIMFYGNKKIIDEAVCLVKEANKINNMIIKRIKISSNNYSEIEDLLKESGLEIKTNYRGKYMELLGREKEVNTADFIIKSWQKGQDKPRESILYQINYLETDELSRMLKYMYPDEQIIINNNKRQLLIKGEKKRVEEIIAIVKKMDIPQKQVIIEARIEEISHTELTDIGVTPDQLSKINIINVNNEIAGIELTWPELLKVLRDKGKAQTLATPKLMAINGKEASLLIGDQIPVSIDKIIDGEVVNEIKYIDAGISLKILPWITNNNEIIININPCVSNIGETIGESLPSINTREVNTEVRLESGETFAIGGLIQDDTIDSLSSIPVLSELPVLGHLFKRKKINNIKTEILIFITPRIIDSTSINKNCYIEEGYFQTDIESYKVRYNKILNSLKDS